MGELCSGKIVPPSLFWCGGDRKVVSTKCLCFRRLMWSEKNSISCLPFIISKAWKSFPLPTLNLFLFPSPFPSSREAYARTKKEKPPFLPEEPSSSSSGAPIPDEILCLICKEIMTDAAIIPCCGNSYCDECKCELPCLLIQNSTSALLKAERGGSEITLLPVLFYT